ncbi:hypothetical protein A2335_02390 [Candidatus Peregrinibacteria bacterium RIFOXYB2_FULL_32_7]|nr:MAG: hypothetical protein A2335_02390 [Candidatus Peregrinibacteria bacterium RIFOXYB2_FULL_32_7]
MKILSFIAPQDYQDQEYGDSKMVLEANGHVVITASTAYDVTGKFGSKTKVDVLLNEVEEKNYSAIIFIGGPGIYDYFDNQLCQKLAKEFYNAGKLTCAICAGPSVLANAGILSGKKATCFESEIENLKIKGANYTGNDVEIDGNIITANGPHSAIKFGEAITEIL